MNCLTGTSYTLLFNGRLQGSFEGKKGLRQGDPISPLLFVLAMEYLTRILTKLLSIKSLGTILCFYRCSGLEANLSKSQVVFGGVAAEVRAEILRSVALGEGSFPLKYLGVSLRPTRWLIADCGEILKKIQNRLHVWASRHLSFAGRTQLIYSVLQGIRNYWMNIFMLPISAVHEIDRLCRNFLWGEKNNRSKFHCSFCSQVCLPKVMGGLGFKEGFLWNKFLLAKYLWALSSKQDVLWVKWIDGVYLKGNSIWDYHLKTDVSWYWRKVCYLRETFSVKDLEIAAPHGKLILHLLYNSMLQKEQVGFAKAVWSSFSVPRHRFILWQAVLGHLLTRDNMARCHIEVISVAFPML
ncbi:uncharacterized protein LOC133832465 [Humulus lupulus]|uniref:uncharacterized protein LOC133832465 n=1 Tax=Humulus lupulus TaxID=3486 RepID=UPI002B40C27D|nr:uncharacterized protein LOC133832465 [Humulus lupulus]